ncbi:FAD-binding-3 domain-containing protein [Fusarium falciforme]|uniref:FAD-binding-3 domain-containing protein n=1 Tax=Fusarium falciforme TaxID=195108 RepID=UPI002301ECC9|nr:FAD-binding-3 domain-containing protein [Fusarium falciforme]WAO95592.1 FAD-binding-3 domain-containing protein [Fusarium falciforme]
MTAIEPAPFSETGPSRENSRDGSKLDIVVVGAGLGGLLAAIGLALDDHRVTVLEQAASFGEVGAGMRIPPNCFKILRRWGVDTTYLKKTHSNGNRFLRYDSGALLADMPHGVAELDFGGSYLMVHRADYHSVLLQRALALGVCIKGGCFVERYDWNAPAAIVQSSDKVTGDLLVITDGVQSSARAEFQGHPLPPTDTEAHVIGYPVRGGEVYNVVFCCSEKSMQDSPFQPGETKLVISDNSELRRRFSGWDPRVEKLIENSGKRLCDLDLVDNWVHPSSKAVLLGDAVHPMLPYMSSGAAMACEDAAVLRKVLSGKSISKLSEALSTYQNLRQPRASKVQKAGRTLQDAYHLPDGEAQQERDVWITKDDERNWDRCRDGTRS